MHLIDVDELLTPKGSYDPVKATWEYGKVVTVEEIKNAPPVVDVVDKKIYDRLNEDVKILSDLVKLYQHVQAGKAVCCENCEYLSEDRIAPEWNRICRKYGVGKTGDGFCDEAKRKGGAK